MYSTKKGGNLINVLVIDYNEGRNNYIVTIEKIDEQNKLEEFYRIIGCQTIDIANYREGFSFVVDDEGLLVGGNPVHEVFPNTNKGLSMQLAGKLIFMREEETIDGFELIGLTEEDIMNCNINIRKIGVVQ